MPAHFNPEFDPADVNTDYGQTGGDITVPTFTADYSPFKFWCQKTLPLVFDDSLSYYEVLCKLVTYVNNLLTDLQTATGSIGTFAQQFVVNQQFLNQMAAQLGTNTAQLESYINDRMDDFSEAYSSLQEYVNTYFANLDVQEEINTKLDQMAQDGTLDSLLQPFTEDWLENMTAVISADLAQQNQTLATQNSRISVLEGRMDTFASLPAGSTSGNAELLDIRTNFLGETYSSAGDAVRASDLITSGYASLAKSGEVSDQYLDGDVSASFNEYCNTLSFNISHYKGGRLAYIFNVGFGLFSNLELATDLWGKGSSATPDSNMTKLPLSYDWPYNGHMALLKQYPDGGERILVTFDIPENEAANYYYFPYTDYMPGIAAATYPNYLFYASNWSKTPVDDTLTQAGEAADAKVTGDAIAEVNSNVAFVSDEIESGLIYFKNYEIVAGTSSTVKKDIDNIPVEPDTVYTAYVEKITDVNYNKPLAVYVKDNTDRNVLTVTTSVNRGAYDKVFIKFKTPATANHMTLRLYASTTGLVNAKYYGIKIMKGFMPAKNMVQYSLLTDHFLAVSDALSNILQDVFTYGGLTSGEIAASKYRVITYYLLQYPFDIVISVDANFRYGVQYYDDNDEFTTDTGWMTTDLTIPKNTKFRLVIARAAGQESSSEVADVPTFASKIHICTPSAMQLSSAFPTGNLIYSGDRIELSNDSQQKFACEATLWKDFTSENTPNITDYDFYFHQSMTIYNGYMFAFSSSGICTIIDCATKEIVSYCEFLPNERQHANSAQFTDLYFNSEDEFPLLLLSRCGNSASGSGADECLIYRITKSETTFTMTLVNSISPAFYTYGASWGIDKNTNQLYLATYLNGTYQVTINNPLIFATFDMPGLTQILSGTAITLNKSDMTSFMEIPHTILQGLAVNGSIIYTGISESGQNLWAVSINKNRVLSKIKLISNYEVEGVAVYENEIYISQKNGSDQSGVNPLKIYELAFN